MRRSGTSKPAVWRWQERYIDEGVDGLVRDKTRPPGIAPLAQAVCVAVLTKTVGETPRDATHWSRTSMAKAVGIVFEEKVTDIVGLSARQGAGPVRG